MKVVILHISDLHRDPKAPLSNAALLESLERDRDRYRAEDPPIPDVNLIIVSGDLVYGVARNASNADAELAKQYAEAEQFLIALADAFVAGERDRVVLVPGNHDISFFHTMRALRQTVIDWGDPKATALLDSLLERAADPTSSVRWSWRDLSFFEILDHAQYNARLGAFSDFFKRFYQGRRGYSLVPENQYHIFDFADSGISIATFNSCWNNDPLNRQGAIHPDCIAKASRELRRPEFNGRIRMAVWHHDTSGPPKRSDYLDQSVVQVLIDSGFTLGFHGHQHKAQFISEAFEFGTDRKLTIISAGTLCAGPKALPPGHGRGYNLVELDTADLNAKVHVRVMKNQEFEQPIWAGGQLPSSGRSFASFTVARSPGPHKPGVAALAAAESLLRNKQFLQAIPILKQLSTTDQLARRMLLECYSALDLTDEITKEFTPPQAEHEVIYLADALWAQGNTDALHQLFQLDMVRSSQNPAILTTVKKYQQRLKT